MHFQQSIILIYTIVYIFLFLRCIISLTDKERSLFVVVERGNMSFTETVVEQKSEHLLLKAIHFGASDLHLMPSENDYLLYFRKYGQLVSAGQLPQNWVIG